MRVFPIFGLVVVFLLAISSCQQRNHASKEMYKLVCLADSLNKANKKMPASSIMNEVANYYEGFGKDEEKVRAYYLLGCSYRDEGEGPMALEKYNKSLEYCQSIRDSSMFALKSRIYGQMGDLFVQQFLPNDAVDANLKAYNCALQAKDTFSAAIFLNSSSVGYNMLGEYEKSLKATSKSVKLMDKIGNKQMASFIKGSMMDACLKLGKIDDARKILQEYEKYSGLFDKRGEIAKGNEIYYYDKGILFLESGMFGSADSCFRKLIRCKDDLNCLEAGYQGLYLLYKKDANKDSLAKYADLAYRINDRKILQLSTCELQNRQQLYDYSRNQKLAQQKQEEIAKIKFCLVAFVCFTMLGLLCAIILYRSKKNVRDKEILAYKTKMEAFVRAKEQQRLLQENRIAKIKENNENRIAQLQCQLAEYQKEKSMSDTQLKEDELQATEICQKFHCVGRGKASVDKKDWLDLEKVLFDAFSCFGQKMKSLKYKISNDDYEMCLLIRLRFAPYEISNILNIKSSSVTMKRQRLLKIIFGEIGGARLFDEKLRQLI